MGAIQSILFLLVLGAGGTHHTSEEQIPRAPQRRWELWSFFTVPCAPFSPLGLEFKERRKRYPFLPLSPYRAGPPFPERQVAWNLCLRSGRGQPEPPEIPGWGHRIARRKIPSWSTTLPWRLVESGAPERPKDRGSECQRDRGSGLRGERTRGRNPSARTEEIPEGRPTTRLPAPGSPDACARVTSVRLRVQLACARGH